MKSISIIGVVLLSIAGLYYISTDFTLEKMTLPHTVSMMAGIGIGLIIGSLVGYLSKGVAMKRDKKEQAYRQLLKEKEALEKQTKEGSK